MKIEATTQHVPDIMPTAIHKAAAVSNVKSIGAQLSGAWVNAGRVKNVKGNGWILA